MHIINLNLIEDPENVIILVTGGSGLVGTALKSIIEKKKDNSIIIKEKWLFAGSIDCNFTDRQLTYDFFSKWKPNYVIHLAAFVGGLYRNIQYPVDFGEINNDLNENILRACHKFNVKKCISCLSTCIFPDKITYPIDETMIHNGPPHSSNPDYSYSKRLIDIRNHAFAKQYPNGCLFTSIIPTNIYGENDNWNLEESHVIPGLIHKFYLAKINNLPSVTCPGSGKAVRQFIYSKDLAKLILWVMNEYNSHKPIILSVGEEDEISISQLVNIITKLIGYTGDIIWDTSKSDGQLRKTASNAKLISLNPNITFTKIEQGIKDTITWFIKNYDVARK